MQESQSRRALPDLDRLSTLAATILLAYTMARYINVPGRELAFQLPGIYISFEINLQTLVSLLVAGITASGAEWLLRDNPALRPGPTYQHWLVPALTAWVISLPLYQAPTVSLTWWIGLAVAGVVLTLVLVAEYIVVDPMDIRQPLAAGGLTAVSFALYLVLAISLQSSEARLFISLPALSLAAWLVSLRTLNLRRQGEWALVPSLVIGLGCGQFAAALHYWPLSPVSNGLATLGLAYALTSLVGNLLAGHSFRKAILEPALVIIIVWGLALWLR